LEHRPRREPMQFIRTIHEDGADARLEAVFAEERRTNGYVGHNAKAFSLRPEVYQAWRGLSKAIRSNMRLRRYELATVAAAAASRCKY
jgi:hypothetical protein